MNCRDDCAGLCFLGKFPEGVSDQWIRPTEENFLPKQYYSLIASDNMADSKDNLKDFEQSLQQLEKIVSKMESGELGLEQSLDQFEQGIKLAKNCQDTLANAELRVEQLIEKNGLQQTIPFEDVDED